MNQLVAVLRNEPGAHAHGPAHVDWDRVRRKIAHQAWAGAWIDGIETLFRRHLAACPESPPTVPTEWSHHYYCDVCANPIALDFRRPFEHHCSSCGRVYADPMKDGAWRTWVHGRIIRNVEWAAILARVRSETGPYIEYIRKTLLFYAEHYKNYAEHGVRVGKGKVMPQSLDEAIWVISAGRYLQWGQGEGWFSAGELDLVRENWFLPAAKLLKPQIGKIHNIHIWLNSAVATCAWWLEDDVLLDWTIRGEFGWERQMEAGVNADGFWWEGSIGYHFYSFHAFASLAQTASDAGVSLWDRDLFQKMLLAPLDLACPDGSLPAHNDSWKTHLYRYAGVYEFGAGIWPEAGLDAALSFIYEKAEPGDIQPWTNVAAGPCEAGTAFVRSSTAALLHGPELLPPAAPQKQESRLFKASGLGILENALVRICLKAGPHGGSHDHCDKLNVDVIAANGWRSEDLGVSGYAAQITKRWYQQPAAHNLPVVDGQRQETADGVILEFERERVVGRVANALPNVVMTREIVLTCAGWKDRCWIEGGENRQLDWCFHGRGQLETSLPIKAAAAAGDKGGFDWLRNVRGTVVDGDWEIRWREGATWVRMHFKGLAGTEVLLATGDDNPAKHELGVVIVRRYAASTLFEAEFEIS